MLVGSTCQRGMALILVLWLLAALSLVVSGVVATQRSGSRQGHAELQQSKAAFAAEGGVSMVVYELLKAPERLMANGQNYPANLDGVTLALSIRSEHGKLDLNFGNLDYFGRFFRAFGVSSVEADLFVSRMRMRRDQGEPLQHLEDLLVVTSMDVALYHRILPFVTLWGGDGVPAAVFADPVLIKAIGLPTVEQTVGNPGSVVSIDVQATLADGYSAGVLATVMITPEDSNVGVFKVLHWQER